MPAYNVERWVEEAVRSVMRQTYDKWELIVVDDGSIDHTGDILRRLAAEDARIRIIRTENHGMSHARNVALDDIRGDYVTFIDSDDLYHPETLQRLMDMMTHFDADVAVGSPVVGLAPDVEWAQTPLPMSEAMLFSRESALECMLYQDRYFNSVWLMLIKSKFFEGCDGLRFVDGLYYEDLELSYRLYNRCERIVHAPLREYFYRKTPGAITQVLNARRFDVLKVVDMIEASVRRDYGASRPALAAAASDRRFSANCNMFNLIMRDKTGRFAEQADRCWRVIKSLRASELRNPRVRLKNRIGALVSYGGKHLMALVARLTNV